MSKIKVKQSRLRLFSQILVKCNTKEFFPFVRFCQSEKNWEIKKIQFSLTTFCCNSSTWFDSFLWSVEIHIWKWSSRIFVLCSKIDFFSLKKKTKSSSSSTSDDQWIDVPTKLVLDKEEIFTLRLDWSFLQHQTLEFKASSGTEVLNHPFSTSGPLLMTKNDIYPKNDQSNPNSKQ